MEGKDRLPFEVAKRSSCRHVAGAKRNNSKVVIATIFVAKFLFDRGHSL